MYLQIVERHFCADSTTIEYNSSSQHSRKYYCSPNRMGILLSELHTCPDPLTSWIFSLSGKKLQTHDCVEWSEHV